MITYDDLMIYHDNMIYIYVYISYDNIGYMRVLYDDDIYIYIYYDYV